MLRSYFIILSHILLTDFCSGTSDGPVVTLPTGKILGRESLTYRNLTYYSFQKIPYARAPVGDLRFKPPQPALPWEGTLDATNLDVSCHQLQQSILSLFDSEDCLFLNVYTPQLPGNEENISLPVMIFIYGGAFISGTTLYYGPDLFVNNGVILVTINYRLGPFGFLSTQDEVIPGNNGLKDQHLAIQWTHDNIHLFGGNPDKITIFGQSAGAGSVGFHLLNQNSVGLFQGAILESGCAISPWTMQRNSRSIAFSTATILNSTFATSNDSRALLDFLQSVDAKDLVAAAEQHINDVKTIWDYDVPQSNYYGPVIETKNPDAFITKKMYGLLEAGNFIKVPIMLGFNSEESLLFNNNPDVLQSILEAWDDNPDLIVLDNMYIEDPDLHKEIARQIRDIYTNGQPFGTNLGAGVRFSTDNAFTRSIIKFAELISKHTETYFYQFSYDGNLLINKLLKGFVHYDGAENVSHTEEIFYMFCSGEGCRFDSESDETTSNRLVKLWTNFAKFQNPTPEESDLLQNLTWPHLNVEDGDFFYLNINNTLKIENHPKKETYQKWLDIYDSLNFEDFDTY